MKKAVESLMAANEEKVLKIFGREALINSVKLQLLKAEQVNLRGT